MPLGTSGRAGDGAGRRSARSSRPRPPSSPPARGRGAGCSSCTRCRRTGCTSPPPGVDPAELAPGTAAGGELLCVAAVTRTRGTTCCSTRWRRSPTCPGAACASAASTATRRSSTRLRRQLARRRARRPGRVRRPAAPGPSWTPRYAAADLLVLRLARRDLRHGRHRGAGPRDPGHRRPPSAACREALGHGADGTGPACSCRPTTRRRSPRRCGPGSTTPSCARGCAGPPASAGRRWPAGRPPRPSRRAGVAGRGGGDERAAGRPRSARPGSALREAADAAARAPDLVERLAGTCRRQAAVVIHDLGCGTGSMGRWLAPRLPGPQHWVAARPGRRPARRSPPPTRPARPPTARRSPSRPAARHHPADRRRPGRRDLVTASALLDMLTADELERLVAACAGAGCPVLLTLSVIGRVELTPADPLDAPRRRRVQRPPAPTTAGAGCSARTRSAPPSTAFARLGCRRPRAAQPLAAGPGRGRPGGRVVRGWVGAACEQDARAGRASRAYTRRRLAQARPERLAVTVHHADLLVLR